MAMLSVMWQVLLVMTQALNFLLKQQQYQGFLNFLLVFVHTCIFYISHRPFKKHCLKICLQTLKLLNTFTDVIPLPAKAPVQKLAVSRKYLYQYQLSVKRQE